MKRISTTCTWLSSLVGGHAAPDSADAQLEIQNYLIEISGEVRDGSGIVTMVPGLLDEPAEAMAGEAKERAAVRFSAVGGVAERPTAGDAIGELPTPPPFQRTRRAQLHVGPLPRGVDLDGNLAQTPTKKPPRPRKGGGR
jgi:hypothetical protein